MRGRKILALAICVLLLLALLPMDSAKAALTVTINGGAPASATVYEAGGKVQIPICFNGVGTIKKIIPTNMRGQILTSASYGTSEVVVGSPTATPPEDTVWVIVEATVLETVGPGRYTAGLSIYYESVATPEDITFTVEKTSASSLEPSTAPTTTPEIGEKPIALILSPSGPNGEIVNAPKGNAGESIQLRLPILNRGSGAGRYTATQIIVTPVLSATLDSFPFVIEAVDYSRRLPDMRPGDLQEIVYNLKLSKSVTSGVKEVKFNCVYFNRDKNAYETAPLSVFVTVVKGATPTPAPGMTSDGETITTQPKVYIEAATLTPDNPGEDDEPDRLYAGEPFTLTMRIRNTSTEEAVKNIQITLSNEGNVVMPANNGSNTLYITKIDPNDVVEREVKLQTIPDAEPKSQNLKVKFAYESSKTLKGYTEEANIAVPVQQRVRVRVNDPNIIGEATLDQAMPISFGMINMGKSVLYNCMVEVEGEGVRMEESFYYGNLAGGNQMQADFNIIPSVEGDIEATLVILFEDAYQKQTRIEKPFTLTVMGMGGGEGGEGVMGPGGMPPGGFEDPSMIEGGEGGGGGFLGMPLWLALTIGGVVLVAGIVALVVVRKKRRQKELTEGL